MTKIGILRKFFGDVKPVTTTELLELRKADKDGFDELVNLCAKALGETIDQP